MRGSFVNDRLYHNGSFFNDFFRRFFNGSLFNDFFRRFFNGSFFNDFFHYFFYGFFNGSFFYYCGSYARNAASANFICNRFRNCLYAFIVQNEIVGSFLRNLVFHDFRNSVVIDGIGDNLRRLRRKTYFVVIDRIGRFGHRDLCRYLFRDTVDASVVQHNLAGLLRICRKLRHNNVRKSIVIKRFRNRLFDHCADTVVIHFCRSGRYDRSRRYLADDFRNFIIIHFRRYGSSYGRGSYHCRTVCRNHGHTCNLIAYHFADTGIIYSFLCGQAFDNLFGYAADNTVIIDRLRRGETFSHLFRRIFRNAYVINRFRRLGQRFDNSIRGILNNALIINLNVCLHLRQRQRA